MGDDSMEKKNYIKEFDGLPPQLREWGLNAVSKIQSPEKRHKVASELRTHLDCLLEEKKGSEDDISEQIIVEMGNSSDLAELLVEEEHYHPLDKQKKN
jgi:hypothetical protein